ncbi:MAG: hypothetical protein ACLUD2_09175 [Clostridium sp.]
MPWTADWTWRCKENSALFWLCRTATSAGKTTTIKTATGLLKPDQGVVELDGKNKSTGYAGSGAGGLATLLPRIISGLYDTT